MYISSIINKYGDTSKVKQDTKTLFDIIDRQGTALLIDALAEYTAISANKFKLRGDEKAMTMIALVDSLEDALKERL